MGETTFGRNYRRRNLSWAKQSMGENTGGESCHGGKCRWAIMCWAKFPGAKLVMCEKVDGGKCIGRNYRGETWLGENVLGKIYGPKTNLGDTVYGRKWIGRNFRRLKNFGPKCRWAKKIWAKLPERNMIGRKFRGRIYRSPSWEPVSLLIVLLSTQKHQKSSIFSFWLDW